jgi:hypothetical protein
MAIPTLRDDFAATVELYATFIRPPISLDEGTHVNRGVSRVKHDPHGVIQHKVCKHMEDSFQVIFTRQTKVIGW